jgi:integrase
MSRRRFGSVRRLPSGRWQARYRTNDGRQHTAPETFATKTAATRHLAQVETDLGRGQWSDPRLGRTTFTEWAARWEATTVSLRGNTRAAYRNLLRRYLLPTFGPMRLADLDAMAVRAWLAKLEREGVGASTRAKSYRLLSRILGTAVESGYLARNPCTIRGAAAEPAPEMRFATVAEVAALAEAIPPRFRALVLVAAYTGLRWGELAGLRVKRVDLLHRRITVAEQLLEVRGRLAFGPTKTGAGLRTVTLPTVAAEAGRAPERLCRGRPGRAGVLGRAGRTDPPQQLHPPGLDPGHPSRRGGGAPLPRPAPHRRHPGGRGGCQHPGADGADGALLLGRGAALPARHGWAGRRHRGRPGRASPGGVDPFAGPGRPW